MEPPQLLVSWTIKQTSVEIQRQLATAQSSMNKTNHLKRSLAKLEATLSRKENQKVTDKSKKT